MGQQTLPPGYRFSPTDEELVAYYLRSKTLGKIYPQGTIADVDVYKFEPWDLPEKSAQPSKDQEWYFFSAQDRKYSHTARINRTTKKGYWKATGKDRKVYVSSSVIGLKKTLIYYEGRAPNGSRTNWVMHEYRLDEEYERKEKVVCGVVLCRIRKKGGPGPRNGEQYGAPISTESIGLEEEANLGKLDDGADAGIWETVENKGGGNAFNLRDQIENWKFSVQMGSSSAAPDCFGPENTEARLPKIEPDCVDIENVPIISKGTTECDSDLKAFFQSISDAAIDMAPYTYQNNGDAYLCHYPCKDTQNSNTLFDLGTLPYLPTLLDADSHLLQDYIFPAFGESEMLRQMSDLASDGKGNVGSTGPIERVLPQPACDVLLGGDYIELDDMKAPLPLRSPIHSSELGRHERQQLGFKAGMMVQAFEDSMHSQGLAPCRAQLQIPAPKERPKAATQAEKCFYGGDAGRFISRENYKNAGNNYFQSYSGEGDAPHMVESLTRSYLSKHMSSYAVSKHEMLPAQLCYASYTDGHDHVVAVNNSAESSAALAVKGKCKIAAHVLTKLSVTPIDSTSSDLPSNGRHTDVGADAIKNVPAVPKNSVLSSGLPTKTSGFKGSSPDVEASQACDPKTEHANTSLSNRHSWKKPLKGLVNKAKSSALGTRIIELENGIRAKFNDKLCALGKPVARVLPTVGNASPYDSLRQVIMATLFQLVAAVLIFFLLFWGSRVLVSHALKVLV